MSKNEKIAIKVQGVSKDFILPHESQDSLKSKLLHPLKRSSGSEKQHALRDISFEVKKGEFFGIVGRNGSGKSTLLKILAEIYMPTKGKVTVNGSLTPFIELGVGFNPELTGRENVYLNGAMLGFSKKEMGKLYSEIVEFAELEKFMDQKLKNYSSGMQVRLAFSVAIRARSDILLLDEVLAVGDADFQRKCFDYFKLLKREGKTVILVSHDMEAIREFCDKAILIDSSRIIDQGKPSSIASSYRKLFIDTGKDEGHDTSAGRRWGNGNLKIIRASHSIKKDYVEIIQEVKNLSKTQVPVVGFSITDQSGKDISGTNSIIEHLQLKPLHKNEKLCIEWSFPNILSDGKYNINLAVLQEDGISTADWWDSAISIKINKERRLPYIIDPGFKVIIK
jgi:ABC-2 type transport system ATP-binding protein